jgi:HlyD family secretion protein
MTEPVESAGTTSLDEFLGAPGKKPWRKWALRGAVALALLLVILLVSRCFGGGDEASYITQTVERGDLTVTVSATGNLKPVNQVDVGSEQSGLITRVYVDVNDRVTTGQLLATLDTSRLLDTVTQGRAQVAAAQAQLAQTEAQAALARATLARQEHVYALSGGRVPSKTELDGARAQSASALANVQAARAQVAVARAQLSSNEINLSKARIVSPVNGVVLSRDIEPGQTVAASFNAPVLFTIAEDLEKMELQVSVDEADVGKVQAGQAATFTVDAFPGRRFPASITRVNVGSNASGTTGSTTSGSSANVVAYTAVLAVNNGENILRPGMTATADILAREVKGALLVPNAALRFTPDAAGSKSNTGITSTLMPRIRRSGSATREVNFGAGSRQTVYVEGDDGTPRAVSIMVGETDGSMSVVTGGKLTAGMKVITGRLASGQTAPANGGTGASGRTRQAGNRNNGS